jgi:hypothetical protein
MKAFRVVEYVLHLKECAYVDTHGCAILPQVHYMIAIVRASKLRLEEKIEKQIEHVCKTGMGSIKDTAPLALGIFDHLLIFHHEFDHVDMAGLAVVAILIAHQFRQGIFGNAQALMEKFMTNHPETFPYQRHLEHARNNLQEWVATTMLEQMISKLPRRLQIGNQPKKIKEIAQRIWTRFLEHGSSTKKDRWTDRGRMLAYIVEHASKHKHVRAQITCRREELGSSSRWKLWVYGKSSSPVLYGDK